MQILTEKDKKAYKEFLENNDRCNFQQSLEWGKVKTAWKNEIVLSKDKKGNIVGAVSVLIRKMPIFGNFMYISRGPICDIHNKEVLKDLNEGLKELAKRYKAFTLKWEPDIKSDDVEFRKIAEDIGFKIKDDVKVDKSKGYANMAAEGSKPIYVIPTNEAAYMIKKAAELLDGE